MAEGDGAIYNEFKLNVLNGVFNLANGGDTIQQTLHTGYTADIDAHGLWGDTGVSTTEYGAGSGYSANGQVLANQATAQDNTNDRGSFDADNVTFTSLGPLTPATPSHTIQWDNTPTSPADPLIAYWELGVKATNGGDYTLQFGANGILLLT